MNNSQKSFLNELAALCGRYGVETIDVKDEHIRIISNNEELYFKEFSNSGLTFYGVVSTKEYYEVTPDTY